MITVFDVETTGKALFQAPMDHPQQPHIVQLAALLLDDNTKEVMALNVIIRPDGWSIPAEAAAIHGITTEYADQVGVPIKTALNMFMRMSRSSLTFVAHNVDFDAFMMLLEFLRNFEVEDGYDFIPSRLRFCTMKAMTPICKLPGNYGDFKWPKLIEAHRHAFGCDFDGAHDALADVRATAKIYFWLKAYAALAVPAAVASADPESEIFKPDEST